MNTKMKTTIKYVGVLLLLTAVSACRGPGGSGQGGGRGGDKPETGDLISRLDKDGDGMVSQAEFDGPAEHFTGLDKDGDGFINAEEATSTPPPRDDQQQR